MMTGFKEFLLEGIQEEVKETIKKLPKAHQALVKGYKFKFEGGNTLKGSSENIGMIHLNNDKKKEIHVAAPWNYPRVFTVLHEVAHVIFEKFMAHNNKLKKEWTKIVDNTKKKVNQSAEEIFCHAYANHFSKNKIVIHTHPEWTKFIEDFCKETG
jgi:transketolase